MSLPHDEHVPDLFMVNPFAVIQDEFPGDPNRVLVPEIGVEAGIMHHQITAGLDEGRPLEKIAPNRLVRMVAVDK